MNNNKELETRLSLLESKVKTQRNIVDELVESNTAHTSASVRLKSQIMATQELLQEVFEHLGISSSDFLNALNVHEASCYEKLILKAEDQSPEMSAELDDRLPGDAYAVEEVPRILPKKSP